MTGQVIGEESVCPHCNKALWTRNIDVGDGFLHDICQSCGFKRKKTMDGEVVEDLCLAENIRRAEHLRKEEGRELK